MFDWISDLGQWLLSFGDLLWGQIDPDTKEWLNWIVGGVVAVIIPVFGGIRAVKMVRAWTRGETTDITDADAKRIAAEIVNDKLATACPISTMRS